jgi:NADH dehydrogenase (ubiquinone) 1 alpha subcomplex subunit 9
MENPRDFKGKTFELEGAQDFTYRELAEFVFDITGAHPHLVDVPSPALAAFAKATELLPGSTMTEDQVKLWSADYVGQGKRKGILTFEDLAVPTTPMEKVAFSFLHRYRTDGGHFTMTTGYH